MNRDPSVAHRERVVRAWNGWTILIPLALILVCDVVLVVIVRPQGLLLLLGCAALVVGLVLLRGFFSLQPNQARVLVLFGSYQGTVRTRGFHWANPFYSNGRQGQINLELARTKPGATSQAGRSLARNKVSLRARTLNGEKLKVNDKRGNPDRNCSGCGLAH